GSWYDQTLESEAAEALIKTHKCVLVSQHADSMGAPAMCEQNGIPNVSYNGSTVSACPNTFLVSSRIDWAPYFKLAINAIAEGKAFDTDWTGTMETGSVVLTDLNDKAVAAGTAEKLAEVKKALQDGSLHVFDTSKYTVGGSAQTSYKADVDSDADYTPDTEVIKDGFFSESEFRSAPYFDVRIDGIELINEKY
ncbi:MAG: BMP family ABC transporter substrate-binding protein, partial [Lachnospiraceae bacterium]|nr:BMP family ABC transporter substrate-binding protein [Lachnospiraceae bacterium]